MLKFTPKPWKCEKSPIFGEWFVRQDPKEWDGKGFQYICSLPADKKGTHYGDMFKANANLIAAAPEMYEALRSIENDNGYIPHTIWKMIQNAISKAEGKETQ